MYRKGFKISCLIFFVFSIFFITQNVIAASSNFSLKILKTYQCMDNRDNDGDGKIDYPEDPDCLSPQDDKEDYHNNNNGGHTSSIVIVIQGETIPNSKVKIIKDGKILSYTKSKEDGKFSQNIYGFYFGNYNFGVITEDKDSKTTEISNFNIELNPGDYISVSNLYISPTINYSFSKKENNKISIFGHGLINSQSKIFLFNKKQNKEIELKSILTNKNGYYEHEYDMGSLENGEYVFYTKNYLNNEYIGKSKPLYIEFKKEENNSSNNKKRLRCDINYDDKVDLIDFSILLFHWLSIDYKEGDFNNDNIVDIKDFSIMAYNWTGF